MDGTLNVCPQGGEETNARYVGKRVKCKLVGERRKGTTRPSVMWTHERRYKVKSN